MSINKHIILETNYFKQYIQDCLNEAWQKYLDTIDKEINFIKEWERSINDRNDYMQWFYSMVYDCNGNRLPDHQFMCDQDTLERFGWVNNSPNTYKSGVHHKMKVESIVKMFYEKAIKEIIK